MQGPITLRQLAAIDANHPETLAALRKSNITNRKDREKVKSMRQPQNLFNCECNNWHATTTANLKQYDLTVHASRVGPQQTTANNRC